MPMSLSPSCTAPGHSRAWASDTPYGVGVVVVTAATTPSTVIATLVSTGTGEAATNSSGGIPGSTSSQRASACTSAPSARGAPTVRSEEHTSELQSRVDIVCRLLLEKTKNAEKSINFSTYHRNALQWSAA